MREIFKDIFIYINISNMNKYQFGVIYKITNKKNAETYIGSERFYDNGLRNKVD